MADGKTTQQTYEERLKRKQDLAGERDTRVVFARTPDTHQVLNIVSAADKAIRILRNRAGMSKDFSPQAVFELIGEFQNAVYQIHTVTKKICEKANINYKPPKSMQELDESGNGDKSLDKSKS